MTNAQTVSRGALIWTLPSKCIGSSGIERDAIDDTVGLARAWNLLTFQVTGERPALWRSPVDRNVQCRSKRPRRAPDRALLVGSAVDRNIGMFQGPVTLGGEP